jgi:alpha-1,2-mannosyltransferase
LRIITAIAAVVTVLVLASTIRDQWIGFWGGSTPYYFFDTDFYRKAVVAVITGTKTMFEAMAYPPFAYLLLWWLPSMPMVEGDQIWTAVTYLVVIAVSVVLNARALEAIGKDWRQRPGLLVAGSAASATLLIISTPMLSQITCGQVSLLVIALPFLDMARVLPRRFEGIFVGLAAAIKVTPAIFGVYYLVTKQWRQAINSLVSFVFFTGVGALFFPGQTLEYWTKFNSSGQEVDPLLPYNWGIRSMIARISLDWSAHSWTWASLGVLVLVATLWRARKLYLRGQGMEAMFIVAAVSVVVPPNSLPHYYTWMPMLAIWLAYTSGWVGRVIAVGVYVLYSTWYPSNVLAALTGTWTGFSLAVALYALVPIAIGVFGLPRRRPIRSAASEKPAAMAVAGV